MKETFRTLTVVVVLVCLCLIPMAGAVTTPAEAGSITNPEAIAFCNNEIRPIAEAIRALDIRINAALIKWHSGIDTIIGTSADDIIEDGREDSGVSRLSAADVVALGAQMIAIQAQLNAAGVPEIVSKPCVRSVSGR